MQDKYTVKFVNSYWVIFDTERYENTQICYLKKDAQEQCKKMNAKVGK